MLRSSIPTPTTGMPSARLWTGLSWLTSSEENVRRRGRGVLQSLGAAFRRREGNRAGVEQPAAVLVEDRRAEALLGAGDVSGGRELDGPHVVLFRVGALAQPRRRHAEPLSQPFLSHLECFGHRRGVS